MSLIYDFIVEDIRGNEVNFKDFQSKVILVVNTASDCGLTSQYEGLEKLYKEYKDQGFVIIGFPCNQFGGQESGSNEEIADFCQLNYGVSFPMMKKVDVNGENAHPVYQWLTAQKGGLLGNKIKWNFTKFLIGKDGKVIDRFAPTTKPKSLEKAIEKALATDA